MAKQQTYTEEELASMQEMDMREEEIRAAQQQGSYSTPYSAAMFAGQQRQNLVEWQLDFSKELIDIERLLRSDILVRDKNGNEEWKPNPNKQYVLFNDQGVQDLLRFIFTLVNKNKVLSNYQAEEIRERICLIKHELRVQIYNNYEVYGLDNEYKMNNYSMIVHTIGSLVEDAYRRAMNGEERRDLNQARMVQQNDPIMPQGINFYQGVPQQAKKGMLSRMAPWNWGK